MMLMYKFVNSKVFTYGWFAISFLLLGITSIQSYTTLTLLFVLTFLDSFSDIWLEHFYTLGVSRKLLAYNVLANALGIVVQFQYGLYGGMVTSMIGFLLLSHKVITWNATKDGKISHFKKEEMTIATIGIVGGVILLGILYGYFFFNQQPWWLMMLNIVVFILGTSGRLLLINGKAQSQMVYMVREIIALIIFISMVALSLTSGAIWMRLMSHVSSLIILLKGLVNWTHQANHYEQQIEKGHEVDEQTQ